MDAHVFIAVHVAVEEEILDVHAHEAGRAPRVEMVLLIMSLAVARLAVLVLTSKG